MVRYEQLERWMNQDINKHENEDHEHDRVNKRGYMKTKKGSKVSIDPIQ